MEEANTEKSRDTEKKGGGVRNGKGGITRFLSLMRKICDGTNRNGGAGKEGGETE